MASTSGGAMPGVSGTAMASNEALLREFQHAEKDGSLPANRLKIQLLGDSCAGKTSLRKHLMGERVSGLEERTVGIERYDLECHHVTGDWKPYKSISEYNRSAALWIMLRNKGKIGESLKHHIVPTSRPIDNILFVWLVMPVVSAAMTYYGLPMGFAASYAMYLAFAQLFFRNWSTVYTFAAGSFFVIVFKNASHEAERLAKIHDIDLLVVRLISVFFFFVLGVWLLYIGVRGAVTGLSLLNPPPMTIWGPRVNPSPRPPRFIPRRLVSGDIIPFINREVGFYLGVSLILFLALSDTTNKKLAIGKYVSVFLLLVAFYFELVSAEFISMFMNAAMMSLGLYLGRKLVLKYRLEYFPKIGINIASGLSLGFTLGWTFSPCIYNIGALAFFIMDICDWWLPLSKTRSKTSSNLPVTELLSAMSAIESGHVDLPIVYTVMDFAGNEEYTNMHYTFIAEEAIYVVVFDLCKLQQKPDGDVEQMERIRHWLNNIRMRVQEGSTPTVFLVGSHRDSMPNLETAEECIKNFGEKITAVFQGSRQFEDWLVTNEETKTVLFTVENTKLLVEDNESTHLRATILNQGKDLLDDAKSNSLKLFHIIDICNEQRGLGRKFLLVDELLEVIRDSGAQYLNTLTLNDLKDYLKIATSKDFVMYRDEDGVSDWVILDPRILVDVMSRFQEPHPNWGRLMERHVKTLESEGITSKKLVKWVLRDAMYTRYEKITQGYPLFARIIEHILSNAPTESDSVKNGKKESSKCANHPDDDTMLEYLKHLRFLVELEPDPADKTKQPRFLLPCRLPKGSGVDVCITKEDALQIYIDCGEIAVEACFPSFISAYLKEYSDSKVLRSLDQCELYRDRAKIYNPHFGMMALQCEIQNEEQHLLKVNIITDPDQREAAIDWLLSAFNAVADKDNIEYTAGVLCPNPDCQSAQNDRLHILPVMEKVENKLKLRSEVWCNDVKIKVDVLQGTTKIMDKDDVAKHETNSRLKSCLLDNWDTLCREMMAKDLAPYLIPKRVITPNDAQIINNQDNDESSSTKLLEIVVKKADNDIEEFVRALINTNQQHLANLFHDHLPDILNMHCEFN